MSMNKLYAWLSATVLVLAALSCSKGDEDPNPNGMKTGLMGKLLYTFVGTVSELDLATNVERIYFTFNTYGFNDWNMGLDGQYRLLSEREPGEYYLTKFTLVKNADGIIAGEFNYDSPNDNGTNYVGLLSPDNTKMLVQPDLHNGIVIADLEGNVLTHLEGINNGTENITLGLGDEVLWLPDHSILFTADERYILRSAPPYTNVNLVREMPYTQWGNLTVNHAGTKIALQVDKHIRLMDVDGQNLVQVTESNGLERSAVFSPDDKYLAVAKKYGDISYWNLAIVPNDGKIHNMDSDPSVIRVQPEGENILAAVDGNFVWIP